MKKTLYLLLVIVMLFTAVACQKDAPVEYTIYYSSTDEIDDGAALQELSAKSADFKLKNANQLDWYNTGEEIDGSDSKQNFEIVINGKTFCGKLVGTKKLEMADADNPKQKEMGIICTYINYDENGEPRELFVIRRDTGELISFQNVFDRNASGQCTSDEAKVIADKVVPELFDKEYMAEYSYESTELQTGTAQSPKRYYKVKYSRYLYGYEVDSITIHVNMAKEVIGVYASDIGKYYKIEERISEKSIEQAYKTLMEFRGIKNIEMTSDTIRLQIAGDGKLYLKSMHAVSENLSARIINVE